MDLMTEAFLSPMLHLEGTAADWYWKIEFPFFI